MLDASADYSLEPALTRLRDMLQQRLGLEFPETRSEDIARAVRASSKDMGYNDAASYLQWLLEAAPGALALDSLIQNLTTGETYFFRDPAVFSALSLEILPQLVQARRASGSYLRLWSAGCSTGEEAYSLAATVRRVVHDWEQWRISVLATDLNSRFLRKARRGLYSSWSFRDAQPDANDANFKVVGKGLYEVAAPLRELVRFSWLNLAEASFPSSASNTQAMDIIFCRNVLMYLSADCARAVLARLSAALNEGGWLFVSPVETSLVTAVDLKPVKLANTMAFRKMTGGPVARVGVTSAPSVASIPSLAITKRRPKRAPPVAAPATTAMHPTALKTAQTLLSRGDSAAVVELFSGIADLEGQGLALLARAQANLGQSGAALSSIAQALLQDKLNVHWNYLEASILLEQGETGAAETALRRTLYADADHIMASVTLAHVLLAQPARRAEALRYCRNAALLLRDYPPDELLADAEGLSAARLREMLESILITGSNA